MDTQEFNNLPEGALLLTDEGYLLCVRNDEDVLITQLVELTDLSRQRPEVRQLQIRRPMLRQYTSEKPLPDAEWPFKRIA